MNWKRALVVSGAVALPLLLLFTFGMKRDPRLVPSPLPGKGAPAFVLGVLPESGSEARDSVRLEALRGSVVVLNFWASWCLACRSEHEALSRVASRYEGRGVRFYGVLYNDSPENGRRWIAEMGGQSYPTLLDPGARTAIDYGLYGVPESFFIAGDGRVAYKHIGPVTEALLVEKLEALLAEGREAKTEEEAG